LEIGFIEKVGGDELANFGKEFGGMADGAGGGYTGMSFSEAWFQYISFHSSSWLFF